MAIGNFALGDAFADLFHNCLIACETKLTIMLLLFLLSRVWFGHVRWENRQDRRRLRLVCRGLCGLHEQTMVWHESADKRLAEVVKKMPTVGNLHCVRHGRRGSLGIQAGSIPADNLRSRMSSKPLRGAL